MDQLVLDASRLFIGDPKKQDEYIADVIELNFPSAPRRDVVADTHRQEKEKRKATRTAMADHCQRCLKAVKYRGALKDNEWFQVSQLCETCWKGIGNLFHDSEFTEPYQKYHHGDLDVDQLIRGGSKNEYYNQTMYDGAKHWAGIASRRGVRAMPSVPRGTGAAAKGRK
jgi:hypothetical protein